MKKIKTIMLLMACMLSGMEAMAQTEETDSVVALPRVRPILTSAIHLLTRCYDDRVYLRWLPEDYVSWLFLVNDGVNVLRVKNGSFDIDTLAYALKPLSEEQFRQKYDLQRDSDAQVAVGVLYGEGWKEYNQTESKPGTLSAGVEHNAEQDISFGFAMLVAEWRPDLACDMAVGFIDRTAKQGETYDYYIQPTVWDNGGKVIFEPGVREKLLVKPFQKPDYDPEIEDSLVSPRRFVLTWVDKLHSSYEIDRRQVTDPKAGTVTEWERVNSRPYISMAETDFEGLSMLNDSVYNEGTWEYRIFGHDAFGELTNPSPIHRVYARDIQAPLPPELKYIVIERADTADAMKKILAHVVWSNPDPEQQDNDVQGYVIKYYNDKIYGEQWHVLSEELIPHTDTIAVVDVTGLRTGMLCLSVYDDSGNEASSLPQLIRITDYKAPDPPDSLKCYVVNRIEEDSLLNYGFALLSWKPNPKDDDIAYFDIAFANDSTHEFLRKNQLGIRETSYVDTLAMDVNQKYVYYKVRAVDWSNNVGEWTPYIRVLRPHNTPPTQPHLGQSGHDDQTGMHMEWIVGKDADMDFHLLYRRVGEKGDWETIARWDADSLAAVGNWAITFDDNPRHNRAERYYYMVESFNSSPYTTQSLAVSWLHQGPKYFDIPIKLHGAWVQPPGITRLTWEVGELPAAMKDEPYYFCVFRKTAEDKRFRYMMDVPSTEQEFEDRSPKTGEDVEYYIMIRFEDGRESTESNTVTVSRNGF